MNSNIFFFFFRGRENYKEFLIHMELIDTIFYLYLIVLACHEIG